MTIFTRDGLVHEHSDDCSHSLDGPLPLDQGQCCEHEEDDLSPHCWACDPGTDRETGGSLGATANSDEPYSP